jgi:hypothetical protein
LRDFTEDQRTNTKPASSWRHFINDRTGIHSDGSSHSFPEERFSTMNNYRARYAFRLDPATEAVLEQLSRHAFLSKASSVGHHVQEGVADDKPYRTNTE